MIARRPLGATGIDLPSLSLGTVKFGRNTAVKYPNRFDLPTDKQLITLLEKCQETGIDLLDTAPAYGSSESRLGNLLPGRRQDWLLSTKAGETIVNGQTRFDFSHYAISSSVEQSLRNLQTDYLDIVMIHSNGNDTEILEHSDAMATLHELKQEGKIRWVGMSTKTIEGGLAAISVSDILMVELSAKDQSQLPVIEAAHNQGCGLLIKKALNSGHAEAKTSLSFVLGYQAVTSVVVGTISIDHLQANIEIAMAV